MNPRIPTAYLDQVGDHHLRGVHALPKQLVVNLHSTSHDSATIVPCRPKRGEPGQSVLASKFHEFLAVMAGSSIVPSIVS